MSRNSRNRPLAPTHALDHALDALAANDPDTALRWAIPALADEGSGAASLDIVGRALLAAGKTDAAIRAHELAVPALIQQGLAPHAVAAALALEELTGKKGAVATVAKAFGAEAPAGPHALPPALKSEAIQALDATMTREQLVGRAVTALQNVPKPDEAVPMRPRLPLWGALPARAFERFARALGVRVCAPGAALMREGERAQSAFVVARGEVRVVRGEGEDAIELAVLGAGAIVGEMALVTEAPRVATVTATRGALVLEAPRGALDDAARDVPVVGEQVVAFCRRQLVENVLRTSTLLREVPASEREGLAALFETRTYDAGDVLIREGETGAGLHLVAAGSVDVRRRDTSGEELQLATLGPGSCVGEISLVLRRPATASVVASNPGVSLVLPATRFLDVISSRPNLLARLYELAVRREDETLSVVAQEAVEIDDSVIV